MFLDRSRFKHFMLALAVSASVPVAAYAQDNAQPQEQDVAALSYESQKRAALMDLARDFVDVVDKGFQQADDYWFSITGNDPAKKDFLSYFQDGEVLLLQIRLPNNVRLNSSVIAEKQGNDVMISLADFFAVARFPISVDGYEGSAEGWYIRENQNFMLDYNNRIVRVNGREYSVHEGDIKIVDQDIRVKGATLARWFNFDFEVNANTQEIRIQPDKKWPVQEEIERERRKNLKSYRRAPPEQPRKEDPYKVAAVPFTDVFIGQRLTRNNSGSEAGTKTETSTNYTIRTAGDLAGHTGNSIISGNDEDNINSVRFKLGKISEDNDLLGPLKARSYEFGDIVTTDIPLVGGARSELGVRVSNKNPYVTQNTFTPITGYAVPGWDVELYRGKQYVGITTVGEDGQYRFDDVTLFAGENKFRIVQYGPQGEIEEEEFSLFVDPTLYNEGQGVYDVSLSLNDRQTYLKNETDDPDRNTPHLSAQYEYQAATDLAVRAGLKLLDEKGESTAYVHGGAVANFDGLIVNADAAIDNAGAYATSLTGRKSYDRHSVAARARYTSEDYSIDSDEEKEARFNLKTEATGRLDALTNDVFKKTEYDAAAEYNRIGDNYDEYRAEAGLATNIGRLRYNTSYDYSIQNDAGGTERNLKGRAGIRGRFMKTNWRATSVYDIYPDYEAREYEISAQRNLSRDFQGFVKLEHKPLEDLSEAEISASWNGDYVRITPSVVYDTEENLRAFLNARFGLAYDPYSNKVTMQGDRLTGRGGVSALVFLDNDGDREYGEGDELIENARVQSVQSRRFALSDADGTALITDLPTNRITDIVLNEGSLPDPFWISGFDGASVRPRPGNITRLEFPVHKSGEIDGTVYAMNPLGDKNTVKNVRLHLYDSEGKLHETSYAAFDGFYIFSRVPPGKYTLIVNAQDAENQRFEPPPPQNLEIGYDGTIIYGNDIVGKSDANGVGYKMADLTDYAAEHPHIDFSNLKGQDVILNLGEYNSRLLMAMTWYHMRNRYGGILGDAKLIVPPSESVAMTDDKKHVMRVKTDILNFEDARLICRSLIARGFECGVELVPEHFFTEISSGRIAQNAGKS